MKDWYGQILAKAWFTYFLLKEEHLRFVEVLCLNFTLISPPSSEETDIDIDIED